VIPVDPSLTPGEAWEELLLMHVRATFTGDERWAVVKCDGACEHIARQLLVTHYPEDTS